MSLEDFKELFNDTFWFRFGKLLGVMIGFEIVIYQTAKYGTKKALSLQAVGYEKVG